MSKTPKVLVVDDNPADVELASQAFAEGKYQCRIHSEEDGEKALAYLRQVNSPKNSDDLRPDLILLDLNLPGKNGQRVLEDLKRDPDLCAIPAIIFSTSQSPRDIDSCYRAGANCYVCKPVNLENYFSAIRSIEQFWFGSALLPLEGTDGIACNRSAD